MAQEGRETDKAKKQNIDWWPITRFFVGLTSLLIGITFLYLTAKTILGREITLIEIAQVPLNFFRGMFTSWPSFVVGFWFLLTFASRFGMLTNSQKPISLVSAGWFIWFIIIGKFASSKSSVTSLVVDENALEQVIRYFGIALYTLLFTDLLDALFWVFNKVEDWISKKE